MNSDGDIDIDTERKRATKRTEFSEREIGVRKERRKGWVSMMGPFMLLLYGSVH